MPNHGRLHDFARIQRKFSEKQSNSADYFKLFGTSFWPKPYIYITLIISFFFWKSFSVKSVIILFSKNFLETHLNARRKKTGFQKERVRLTACALFFLVCGPSKSLSFFSV